MGKRPEAEEQYRKALAIQEKLVAEFPAVPEYRRDLALSHNNLGILLSGLRKRPEAEEQYRKALAIQEKLVAEFPAVPEYRKDLAGSHNNLGDLLTDLGKRPEAEAAVSESPGDPGEAGRRLPRRAGVPQGPRPQPQQPGNSAGRPGEAAGGGASSIGKPWRSRRSWSPSSPPCRNIESIWVVATAISARLLSNSGQPGESLEWFEKAIRTLTAVYEQDRRLVVARAVSPQ